MQQVLCFIAAGMMTKRTVPSVTLTTENSEAFSEEDIKMFKEELSKIEDLTDEGREEINMFIKESSKMEHITDDYLENITGGVSENIKSNLTMEYRTFQRLAEFAFLLIHKGEKWLAHDVIHLLYPYREHPVFSFLCEEFKKKFGFDPLNPAK